MLPTRILAKRRSCKARETIVSDAFVDQTPGLSDMFSAICMLAGVLPSHYVHVSGEGGASGTQCKDHVCLCLMFVSLTIHSSTLVSRVVAVFGF